MDYYTGALIILVLSCINLAGVSNQDDRVLLRETTAIILKKGLNTNARRLSPIPQLQCVGGTAGCDSQPDSVVCYNEGVDQKNNVKWYCSAKLPDTVRFGDITVTCEGYDSNDDAYILIGSCGLKYTLVKYVAPVVQNAAKMNNVITSFVLYGAIGFVGALIVF